MSYSLFLEKQVIKFLLKLDEDSRRRIFNKIEKLKQNPMPQDSKRIVNVKEVTFRIRVGMYRILYRLEDDKLIIVFLIDKRSKIYKK